MAARRNTRIFIVGIISALTVLLVVGALALFHVMTKSLPEQEGGRTIPGISGEVQIIRDPAGIPHILANAEYDAYVAAGYVHAQDRLWQMDMARRYGMGRLAEVLGSEAVPVDRLMRTVGITALADSLLRTVSAQTRNILQAYSRGVNAYIHEMEGRYPLEFDLLQYAPEEWTPTHSLVIARLMGWELALSWWVDLTLGELVQKLGEEKARSLFPSYPDDAPLILPPDYAPSLAIGDGMRDALLAAQRLSGTSGSAIGSNSWVVTRDRSSRGSALLANDPHLLYMQPARWYIMHIEAPGLNVAGVSVPGAPAIVIGHNSHIAWGMTNLMADDVDFFVEDVNYRDSTYRIGERILPLQVRTDSILVKDSLPVVIQVYSTVHGPIITDVYPQKGVLRKPDRFTPAPSVSMRWAGQDASDEILALYRINHAKNWNEFLSGLSLFGVPAQNFTFGDIEGNIGYTAAGHIPLRDPGISPQLPNDGTGIMTPWRGMIPFADLPRSYNPPGNVLATANNRIVASYPQHLSSLWESDGRISRIRQLLQDQPNFSAADFKLMQMDVLSVSADTIRDALVGALRSWPSRPVLLTRVMNMLAKWDCRMHVSSVEASIFNVAYVRLLHNTFEDEMDSTLFRNYVFLSNIPTRVFPRLLADTSTTIFDDVRTPRRETRQHILIKSITEAVMQLRRQFGANMQTWAWGDLHTVTFRHLLGATTPLDHIFNVGPYAIGGNNTTVNNGEFSFNTPYDAAIGPSMRFIADLASPDSSYIILTTGQSGQVFSDHYADHTALWQSGALHRLIINRQAILNAKWKRLVLRP
ncbi:MAG: penicillin acylase family protein [Bacteroidetes bacterium]|nr:penicillin acylase family protein [Bacteroidota bacterium]